MDRNLFDKREQENVPTLDKRTQDDLYRLCIAFAKEECSEWAQKEWPLDYFDPDDPGLVLFKLFSQMAAHLGKQLNRIPIKHRMAFFHLMGLFPRPPESAKVPITFYLAEDAISTEVPEGTQVAHKDKPEVVFVTEQDLTVVNAGIRKLYSLNPWTDRYMDHTPCLAKEQEFRIFDMPKEEEKQKPQEEEKQKPQEEEKQKPQEEEKQKNGYEKYPIPHILYLGDDSRFDIPENTKAKATITLTGENLKDWFTKWQDGADKDIKPENRSNTETEYSATFNLAPFSKTNVAGQESFWLSVQASKDVLDTNRLDLPRLSEAKAAVTVSDMIPAIVCNDTPVDDPTKGFFPFGERPRQWDTLYIGSQAFSKSKAEITIAIECDKDMQIHKLEWEYWDSGKWEKYTIITKEFAKPENWWIQTENQKVWAVVLISEPDNQNSKKVYALLFKPTDQKQEKEINGQQNWWIRAIVPKPDDAGKGLYGQEGKYIPLDADKQKEIKDAQKNQTLIIFTDYLAEKWEPPFIRKITVGYKYDPTLIPNIVFSNQFQTRVFRGTKAEEKWGRLAVVDIQEYLNAKNVNASLNSSTFIGSLTGYKKIAAQIIPSSIWDNLAQIEVKKVTNVVNRVVSLIKNESNLFEIVCSSLPFEPVMEERPCLYLGFGPEILQHKRKWMTLYFLVKEDAKEHTTKRPETPAEKATNSSTTDWMYYDGKNWKRVPEISGDTNMTQARGLVWLKVPEDIQEKSEFGKSLYWLKVVVTDGEILGCPVLRGIYQNTVYAVNTMTVKEEVLGSSSGLANQEFSCSQRPLQNAEVKVNEYGVWMDWTRPTYQGEIVDDFRFSNAGERHYVLDAAAGKVIFGDGKRGMIPPMGQNNILAKIYIAGGGIQEEEPDKVNVPKKAIPSIESVRSHKPVIRGSDQETDERFVMRSSRYIKHIGRAVTCEDFESIALESQLVAQARCTDVGARIKVCVVPASNEKYPNLQPELAKKVREILQTRCFFLNRNLIEVVGPKYIPVQVQITAPYKESLDPLQKNEAKQAIESALNKFFHHATGRGGKGWRLGDWKSDNLQQEIVEYLQNDDLIQRYLQKDSKINVGLQDTTIPKDWTYFELPQLKIKEIKESKG